MEKLKIGFVGLGRIADVHIPGYINNPDAELYAVCSRDMDEMLKRKDQWGAKKHYIEFDDMIADPEIDAIEILSPTNLHEEMTIKALKAGKHVAVQKPMANNLASADRMIAAAKKYGKLLKVSDNYVFYPPIMLARKMIENGDIGTPANLRIKLIGGGKGGWEIPPASWEWRIREAQEDRGLLTFDHGHHLWASAWFLLGDIDRISAWIESADGVIDAPATVMWRYKNGTRYGICEICHESDLTIPSKYYANDEWIEITGTKGIIIINRCTGSIKDGPSISFFNGDWHEINVDDDWVEGFKGNTHNFINSILGKEQPFITAEQGRYILKISLAIQKSNRLHREVYMDEMDALIPDWYAKKMRSKLVKGRQHQKKSLLERIGLAGRTSQYAPLAKKLTDDLLKQFDEKAAGDWSTIMGLELFADGGCPVQKYTLIVKEGKAFLAEGFPDNPVFTIRTEAGMWAAILLKKKRVEVAFLQGKIKVEGRSEEGLKLRPVFKL